ncbi:MAG: carbohydrate kinase [Niabella sp.]|nr:MAG: carbohydrate kinase [Niabella sp.]
MNVCYHLNQLGHKASIISKIGNDENGKALVDFLDQHNIETSLIQTHAEYSTGTVIATVCGNEMSYDIVKPVAWDFIEVNENVLKKVANAQYLVCGSLAARNIHSKNALFQLMKVAKTIIVDINLRPPHFDQLTIEQLLEKADILKLNHHELGLISGWHNEEINFENQILFLAKRYSISTIMVTKGENGATLFTNHQIFNHPGYKVKVNDTIGSGDAFLAGFLSKQYDNIAPEIALDFACKLGAFVASKKGACPEYKSSEVDLLNN